MRPYFSGIRHDYKDSAPRASTFNTKGLPWFAIGLVLPLVGVLLLLFSETNQSMVPEVESTATVASALYDAGSTEAALPPLPTVLLQSAGERVTLPLPPLTVPSATSATPPRSDEVARDALLVQGAETTLVVRNGDSLDQLFRRNGLSVTDLTLMLALPEAKPHLAKILPADRIEIVRDGERVLGLSRDISESQRLWIQRDGEGFMSEIVDLGFEIRTAGAHGMIEETLWEAANDAGLDSDVIGKITEMFAWDVDFFLDVRAGDSFTVVYEERWRDGVKLSNGEIIAAEYVNQGKAYRAARYVDAAGNDGHYTPDGKSVERPFLRAPLEFTRVSSNFNPRRQHPILNTIRAHRGVDYAAPTGTEVQAAGEGRIIARGANGSYGNRVEIQHGGNITTLYAHLSRFGSFRVGDHVEQGDIIGYVGMTGGATGPHLHYEYREGGVHRNPRTVELPDAEPILDEYREDFMANSASLWRQLDLYETTQLAQNVD